MACFSHWWTTTSSVTGSTSATRAVPGVEQVDGLGHHRQGVGVAGPSSEARAHNSSIWDWRSAMARR